MRSFAVPVLAFLALLCACEGPALEAPPALRTTSWRFAVVGDLHLTATRTTLARELVAGMLADEVELVLLTGDQVSGGDLGEELVRTQLDAFFSVIAPLTRAGIAVHPVRGNRERTMTDSVRLWTDAVAGPLQLPRDGPPGEVGLTYSVARHNALFLALDVYATPHRVNLAWLDAQLAANDRPHVFVFAHEAAFKTSHSDILDDYPDERNAFWRSLSDAGVRVYLCGHDHHFDVARLDDGDGDPGNDVFQTVVGTGGGSLLSQYAYAGPNEPYLPVPVLHASDHGYLLIELSGTGAQDLEVTLTWKMRVEDLTTGAVHFQPVHRLRTTAPAR